MADRDSRLLGAKNLGFVPPTSSRRDKLSQRDTDDLFRVSLSQRSKLEVGLSGVSKKANFDIELYSFKQSLNQIPQKDRKLEFRNLKGKVNRYLTRVGTSKRGKNQDELISQNADAGEYLIRVSRRTGNSRYTLSTAGTPIISTTPTPTPSPGGQPSPSPTPTPSTPTPTPTPIENLPGNSLATSFAIANLTAGAITGSVSEADKQDFHRFTLSSGMNGDYLFTVSGLQGNGDVEILKELGGGATQKISSFTSTASANEKFIQPLDDGTYYFRFFQKTAGTSANYSLTATKLADTVENTIPDAATLTLGPTVTTRSNYVVDGGKQSSVDYYRFTLTKRSFLSVDVSKLFGNLNVQLARVKPDGSLEEGVLFDSPSNSPSGTYGEGREVFGGTLDPKGASADYVLRIFAPQGSGAGSTYDISLKLSEKNTQPSIARDIRFGSAGSAAKNLVKVGGFTFFAANDGEQTSLWKTDGTLDGTERINKTFTSIGNLAVAANNTLYFVAEADNTGTELWKATVDGQVSLVQDLSAGTASTSITNAVAAGDRLYFVGEPNGEFKKFYRTNAAGTAVEEITSGNLSGSTISELTVIDNGGNKALFFSSNDFDDNGAALWRILNTDAASITPERISLRGVGENANPRDIVQVGPSTLYLTAVRSAAGQPTRRRLVKVDDIFNSTVGNVTRTNILNLPTASTTFSDTKSAELTFIKGATAAEDVLYFVPDQVFEGGQNKGRELMRLVNPLAATGSTVAELVSDLNTASSGAGSDPTDLTVLDGRLFFVANNGTGNKLWYTDGTSGTTNFITELRSGQGYDPNSLTVVDDTLFFVANNGTIGRELWSLTGGTTTAQLVQNINVKDDPSTPGSELGANPQQLVSLVDELFFVADDGDNGLEVWSVAPGASL